MEGNINCSQKTPSEVLFTLLDCVVSHYVPYILSLHDMSPTCHHFLCSSSGFHSEVFVDLNISFGVLTAMASPREIGAIKLGGGAKASL